LFGDHPGSPRRDDRQFGGPEQPQQFGEPERLDTPTAAPEDIRVAGASATPSIEPVPGPAPAGHRTKSRTPLKIAAVVAGVVVTVGGGAVAAKAMTGGGEESTVKPGPVADAPKPDPAVVAAERDRQNRERASRDTRKESGKSFKLAPKGTPPPTPTPTRSSGGGGGGGGGGGAPVGNDPVPSGVAQAYAKSVLPTYFGATGRQAGQFGCLVNLWMRESGWRTTAANPSSGAYGIPQALPGSKMATEGADWRTNHKTQIKWGLKYIKSRYGTPCGGWNHFLNNGWY
jgi:hypothetical protein